uniref:Uncharacterized protein n=1 Tax=Arundo donax TaxID=35708 RepID=A0A0A9B5H0_ARUDO
MYFLHHFFMACAIHLMGATSPNWINYRRLSTSYSGIFNLVTRLSTFAVVQMILAYS